MYLEGSLELRERPAQLLGLVQGAGLLHLGLLASWQRLQLAGPVPHHPVDAQEDDQHLYTIPQTLLPVLFFLVQTASWVLKQAH